MELYADIIKEALLFFPVLAFFVTIPYIIHNYRKFGSVLSLRILIVYSFVLYLLCAYFLVILPLPSRQEAALMTGPRLQMIPFHFVADIIKEAGSGGIFSYINNPALFQMLFNVAMTIPFGMYLRYYFKKNLKTTVLYTFLLSLFFELTQLSGLYFIYPRGYRLFDVDDLILNTSGGLLGYFLGGLLTLFLPKREEIDERSYESGKHISFFRRVMSVGFDVLLYLLFSSITYFIFKNMLISYFVYFVLIPFICNGKTLGQMYMKIQMVTKDDQKIKLFRLTIRQFSCLFIYILLPFLVFYLMRNLTFMGENIYALCFICSGFVLFLLYLISFIRLFKKKTLFHEMITGTKMISVIKYEPVKQEEIVKSDALEESE